MVQRSASSPDERIRLPGAPHADERSGDHRPASRRSSPSAVGGTIEDMIERERYDELIAIAPVMFHVTAARNLSDILRDGLRPGSDIGVSTLDNFFRTRRDHVYLIRQREVPIVDVEDPRVIAVDMAALDHRLVDPDEDAVAEKFPEMVSIEPPMRALNDSGEEEPGQVGARADWADTTPGFDRSEVTERSIREGRLAYRGVIPPGALQQVTIQSPSILGFVTDLPDDLRSLVSTDAPRFSGWRSEVERGRAIVRTIVLAVLRAVGEQVEIRVSDPADVPATAHSLIRVAAALARRGELNNAEAVAEARHVVEMLGDLMGFPLSDLDQAQDAARAAGRLTSVLEALLGIDLAGRSSVVKDALTSAEAIPPSDSEARR